MWPYFRHRVCVFNVIARPTLELWKQLARCVYCFSWAFSIAKHTWKRTVIFKSIEILDQYRVLLFFSTKLRVIPIIPFWRISTIARGTPRVLTYGKRGELLTERIIIVYYCSVFLAGAQFRPKSPVYNVGTNKTVIFVLLKKPTRSNVYFTKITPTLEY